MVKRKLKISFFFFFSLMFFLLLITGQCRHPFRKVYTIWDKEFGREGIGDAFSTYPIYANQTMEEQCLAPLIIQATVLDDGVWSEVERGDFGKYEIMTYKLAVNDVWAGSCPKYIDLTINESVFHEWENGTYPFDGIVLPQKHDELVLFLAYNDEQNRYVPYFFCDSIFAINPPFNSLMSRSTLDAENNLHEWEIISPSAFDNLPVFTLRWYVWFTRARLIVTR